MKRSMIALLTIMMGSLCSAPAWAEANEVRIAQQPGLGLLPLFLTFDQKLIEKNAAAAGLGDVKVTTVTTVSGQTTNDALIAGAIDVAVTGSPALITLWDRTIGRNAVKGMMSISYSPIYFNSIDPALVSIDDLKPTDRVAITAVGVSGPAYLLQIYAAKKYGWDNRKRFDANTVSMSHPEAMRMMLSDRLEVKTHAASLPYLYQELKNPKVHTILNSNDIANGKQTFAVAYATERWKTQNPKLYAVVAKSFAEAMDLIARDRKLAAEIFSRVEKTDLSIAEIVEILGKEDLISYKPAPMGIEFYADFMHRSGTIKTRPASWKDIFWENVHDQVGN